LDDEIFRNCRATLAATRILPAFIID
jgi:hypothetical protein